MIINLIFKCLLKKKKRRVEKAITDLQLRLMRLSRLTEKLEKEQEITPTVLSLFSKMDNEEDLQKSNMDRLPKNIDKIPAFNLYEWRTFVKDLSFCFEKDLPVTHKKMIKCILYWKKEVLNRQEVT